MGNPNRSRPPIRSGETPLLAFISSVMSPEMTWARDVATRVFDNISYATRWTFEYTPASSENVDESYLRKVREADIVIWLVGDDTTEPVQNEVREALSSNRRLLAFKLPSEKRSRPTTELLAEVGSRAKWQNIEQKEDLNNLIALSLEDEIIRALRVKPGIACLTILEELYRESKSRCLSKWQVAGVTRMEAERLFSNEEIGKPTADMEPSAGRPIIVLVGEAGAGKTLFAERLFQKSILRYRERLDSPIPVYLEASSARKHLREEVKSAVQNLGNPSIQGVALTIDGVDEVGDTTAATLLDECRVLAGTWPNMSIIMTSRELPSTTGIEEMISVPLLSQEDSYALISRIVGQAVTPALAYHWPDSVVNAIKRPLFAILMGVFLSQDHERSPRSTGELLTTLVEQSLRSTREHKERVLSLLQKFGALSIDRNGGYVPIGEISSITSEQELLRNSRLVVEKSRAVKFPLHILAQWFAAQSLLSETTDFSAISKDLSRSERWKFPAVIAVGTFGNEDVSRIIKPIVENRPALAAEIVEKGIARWSAPAESSVPAVSQCAKQIRSAMRSWARGIGPLANLIAPTRSNGDLFPLGISIREKTIVASWCEREEEIDDIIEFPNASILSRSDSGFKRLRFATLGRQSAWSWRWALEDLQERLSDLLSSRLLPIESGPLALERVWATALEVSGHGSLYSGVIPLKDIMAALEGIAQPETLYWHNVKTEDLDFLRFYVESLHQSGQTTLRAPWPGPDRERTGAWVWSPYSPEGLLARTIAIFDGAMMGYRQVVETWFPKFVDRLQRAVMLPARLIGTLIPPNDDQQSGRGPYLSWYMEPLQTDKKSEVNIQLGERSHDLDVMHSVYTKAIRLRPHLLPLGISFQNEYLQIFGSKPVTEIVYSWLKGDLKRTSFLQ